MPASVGSAGLPAMPSGCSQSVPCPGLSWERWEGKETASASLVGSPGPPHLVFAFTVCEGSLSAND